MANVWVGDNYYITKVYSLSRGDEGVGDGLQESYMVHLQRLPESSYASPTEVHFMSNTDSIALGLSNENFIAAILPKINTALDTDDASDKSDGHSATSTGGYSVKI